MPASLASPRPAGGPSACGVRRPAARRRRAALLAAALALAACAGAQTLLSSDARAQTQQPAQPTPQQQPSQPTQQQPQGQATTPGASAASGEVHGDWIRRCTSNPPPDASPPQPGEQTVCFLIQQVADQQSRRPLLKITVGFFGPERQTGAVIAMPLGVPLARGLHISVDGQEVDTIPFQFCRRDGCTAYLPLPEAAVNAFKAGSQAQARVESPQGEAVNLPISLNGFTAGFGAIQ